MTALRGANDVLAFALELAALAAFVVWGFAVGPNLLLRIVIGVGAAALMIAVWGYWLAPRARHRLPRPGYSPASWRSCWSRPQRRGPLDTPGWRPRSVFLPSSIWASGG